MKNRNKAYLALFGNAVLWGAALPLVKRGFAEITPISFLFYRYLFAVLTGLPIVLLLKKKIRIKKGSLLELIGIGFLCMFLAHWALYEGLDKTSALEASILITLSPIFIVVGGAAFLKEKVTLPEKIGITIAFLGSLVIVLEPLFQGAASFSMANSLGNIMVVAYNFFWAVALLWMKKVAKKYHPFTLSYSSFWVGMCGFLAVILAKDPTFDFTQIFSTSYGFVAALYMGILGSVVAFFLYQYSQQFIEASEATLFSYLSTLCSIPLAIIWLGEKPTTVLLIGGFIVVAGVILAEQRWKLKR